MLSLIEGTLDVARIESGKLALQVAPMHFAEGMQAMADLFALQAQAKGLQFHYQVQGTLPAVVRADEKRLRQIIINLLGNAIKFTPQGSVSLQVKYARQMATSCVIDTGPGRSQDEQARIFEPFERGAAAATAGGAGLGLTMAKMLPELMGGALPLHSQTGQGACFQVSLFVPSVDATQAQPVMAQAAPTGYAGARQRILVVDNEEADRGLLLQLLAPLGFEVQLADSGYAALALGAGGWVPHAVLMDLAMPGIDGWETLRRLRAMHGQAIACAVVSANAFDRDLPNDAGITPQDFMVKPVRHSELLQWLGQRPALRWEYGYTSKPPLALMQQGQVAINVVDDLALAGTAQPGHAEVPHDALAPLCQALQLGYVRGVRQALDVLERDYPAQSALCRQLRQMAQQFDMDGMARTMAQHGWMPQESPQP